MVWPDLAYDLEREHPLGHPRVADPVAFDYPLFNFYQEAIALRNASNALRRGSYEALLADDGANVFVFRRQSGDETYVVALNRADEPRTVSFSAPAGTYEMVLSTTSRGLRMAPIGETLELEIGRRTGVVLRHIGS
jgi:hypothetical protein